MDQQGEAGCINFDIKLTLKQKKCCFQILKFRTKKMSAKGTKMLALIIFSLTKRGRMLVEQVKM